MSLTLAATELFANKNLSTCDIVPSALTNRVMNACDLDACEMAPTAGGPVALNVFCLRGMVLACSW